MVRLLFWLFFLRSRTKRAGVGIDLLHHTKLKWKCARERKNGQDNRKPKPNCWLGNSSLAMSRHDALSICRITKGLKLRWGTLLVWPGCYLLWIKHGQNLNEGIFWTRRYSRRVHRQCAGLNIINDPRLCGRQKWILYKYYIKLQNLIDRLNPRFTYRPGSNEFQISTAPATPY